MKSVWELMALYSKAFGQNPLEALTMRADLLIEMLQGAGELAMRFKPSSGPRGEFKSRYYQGERLGEGLAELRKMVSMKPGQIVGRGV